MHRFSGSTAFRGFSIDQSRPDHNVSYGINRMRQDAAAQEYAKQCIKEDTRIRLTNEIVEKKIKQKEVRYTMDQIRMKIQFREHQRRMRIQMLFDQEYAEYQRITGERKAYESAQSTIIARLEEQANEIKAKKQQENDAFVEAKREQQFELNCDELRQKQDMINARMCRLHWEMQQNDHHKRNDHERAIDLAIDSMTINDFKKYEEEQKLEPIKRMQRQMETRKMLDDCHDDRKKFLATEKLEDTKLDRKQQELWATGNAIEEQEKRVRQASNLLNRDELMTQLAVEEAKKKAEKEQALREGKEEYEMVLAEIARQQEKQADDKVALRNMQDTFQAMETIRKANQQFIEDRLDQGFAVKCINDDWKAYKRQQREEKERRRIADIQCRENMEIAERKYYKVDEKAAKKAERERLLADYQAYLDEERAKAERQRWIEERNLAELYNQNYVKFKKLRALEREDVQYADAVKTQVLDEENKINRKLGDINDKIKELDGISLLDDRKRPLKKKQWYNV